MRYDTHFEDWLLYSSEGFFSLSSLDAVPKKIECTPVVSVMGLTAMEQMDSLNWMMTSFSGAYRWNRAEQTNFDCIDNKYVPQQKGGMPTFDKAISGYTADLRGVTTLVSYDKGTDMIAQQPVALGKGRMSYWHLALECHVGRIFQVFPMFEMLYVFVFGGLFIVILISGYFLVKKRR